MSILKNYGSAILRVPEGGEGAAGAGGAGGAGAGAGGAGEKPMTAAEIQTLVGNTVNSAVTAQLKRTIGPSIAEALKAVPWGEVLKPEIDKLKPETPAAGAGAAGAEAKPDPKFSALEGQFADLKKKYDASEAARLAAEQKSKDDKAFSDLRTALTPHVRPEALDIAAKNLFLAEKRVTTDENGNALLTVRRAPFAGGAEEDVPLPLADGVKHWIGTPEGKFFAPAPGGAGAGQQQRGGQTRHTSVDTSSAVIGTGSDEERGRRASARAAELAQKYPDT